MKFRFYVLLLCSCGLLNYFGSITSAVGNELIKPKQLSGAIIPGKNVGPLFLGDTHDEIIKILGNPSVVNKRSTGISEAKWDFTSLDADSSAEDFKPDRIYIIYAGNKAIQIGITSPKYTAPGGYTTRNTLAQIFRRFKNLTSTVFGIEDPEGGGYRAYFYDNVQAGLAFMLGAQDDFDNSATPDYIFIHRAGKSVLPERNATRIKVGNNSSLKPSVSASHPSPQAAAERREKLLSAQYLQKGAKIYLDSEPMLKNLLDYAIRERDGSPLPRAVWKKTLDNLEANVRRYKLIKPIPGTMKKAHSYAIGYTVNTIKYINYMREWIRTGNEGYVTLSQPYVDASAHYAELMMKEYERVANKVSP